CDTMIAYNYEQYPSYSRNAEIEIVPSQPRHVDQMVDVMCAAYDVPAVETYTPEQFLSQVRVFPEGQFVAVDANDRVVGLTISMRVDYQPEQPLLESWIETTNYG